LDRHLETSYSGFGNLYLCGIRKQNLEKKTPIVCPVRNCGLRCVRITVLKSHITRKHCKQSYVCDLCEQRFVFESTMLVHRESHGVSKPFNCQKCNASFPVYQQYKLHIRTHVGEKIHTCELCGQLFPSGKTLLKHKINEHTNVRNFLRSPNRDVFSKKGSHAINSDLIQSQEIYQCNFCKKRFKSEYFLGCHFKDQHNKGKVLHARYQCDTCGVRLKTHTGYILHRKNHYKCTLCGSSFESNIGLNVHIYYSHKKGQLKMKKHCNQANQKKFSCPFECAKIYKTQIDLDLHLVEHTGHRSFTCETCAQTFDSYASLIEHDHNVDDCLLNAGKHDQNDSEDEIDTEEHEHIDSEGVVDARKDDHRDLDSVVNAEKHDQKDSRSVLKAEECDHMNAKELEQIDSECVVNVEKHDKKDEDSVVDAEKHEDNLRQNNVEEQHGTSSNYDLNSQDNLHQEQQAVSENAEADVECPAVHGEETEQVDHKEEAPGSAPRNNIMEEAVRIEKYRPRPTPTPDALKYGRKPGIGNSDIVPHTSVKLPELLVSKHLDLKHLKPIPLPPGETKKPGETFIQKENKTPGLDIVLRKPMVKLTRINQSIIAQYSPKKPIQEVSDEVTVIDDIKVEIDDEDLSSANTDDDDEDYEPPIKKKVIKSTREMSRSDKPLPDCLVTSTNKNVFTIRIPTISKKTIKPSLIHIKGKNKIITYPISRTNAAEQNIHIPKSQISMNEPQTISKHQKSTNKPVAKKSTAKNIVITQLAKKAKKSKEKAKRRESPDLDITTISEKHSQSSKEKMKISLAFLKSPKKSPKKLNENVTFKHVARKSTSRNNCFPGTGKNSPIASKNCPFEASQQCICPGCKKNFRAARYAAHKDVCPDFLKQQIEKLKGSLEKANKGQFVCPTCLKVFPTPATLETHKDVCPEFLKQQIEKLKGSLNKANQGQYVCPVCHKTFDTPVKLDKHQKNCSEISASETEENLPCHLCDKVFTTKGRYDKHITLCTQEKLSCPVCDQTFTSKVQCDKHVALCMKDELSCPTCDKMFTTKSQYEKHTRSCMNNHLSGSLCDQTFNTQDHNDQHFASCTEDENIVTSATDNPLTCKTCNKVFMYEKWYNRHKVACCTDNGTDTESSETYRPLKCKICGKVFSTEGWYERHVISCTKENKGREEPESNKPCTTASMETAMPEIQEEKLVCSTCDMAFTAQGQYDKHVTLCMKDQLSCPTCDKTFTTHGQYDKHVESCMEEQLACLTCEKVFTSWDQYEKHSITCTNDDDTEIPEQRTQWTCKTCDKVFMFEKWYNRHVAYCPNADINTERSDIYRHMKCKNCDKVFSTEGWYERHILSCVSKEKASSDSSKSNDSDTTEKMICKACEKVFTAKWRYDRHIFYCPKKKVQSESSETNKPTDQMICKNCDKVFAVKWWYEKHILTCVAIGKQFLTCPVCQKQFPGNCLSNFESHRKLCSETKTSSNRKPSEYVCSTCGRVCYSIVWFNKHRQTCGNIKAREEISHDYEIQQTKTSTEAEKYKSSSPNWAFSTQKKLICPTCKATFTSYGKFSMHRKHCTNPIKTCPMCNKVFSDPDWWIKHRDVCEGMIMSTSKNGPAKAKKSTSRNGPLPHTQHANLICKTCKKVFSSQAWLEKHLEACRDIEDEKNQDLSCSTCGKRFSNHIWYDKHTKACQNESCGEDEALTCKGCSKVFSAVGWFDKHQGICPGLMKNAQLVTKAFTEGPQPHTCKSCQKTFAVRGWYERHIETCTSTSIQARPNESCLEDEVQRYSCPGCKKSFIRFMWFETHKKKCPEMAKLFVCPGCKKVFRSRQWFENHRFKCSKSLVLSSDHTKNKSPVNGLEPHSMFTVVKVEEGDGNIYAEMLKNEDELNSGYSDSESKPNITIKDVYQISDFGPESNKKKKHSDEYLAGLYGIEPCRVLVKPLINIGTIANTIISAATTVRVNSPKAKSNVGSAVGISDIDKEEGNKTALMGHNETDWASLIDNISISSVNESDCEKAVLGLSLDTDSETKDNTPESISINTVSGMKTDHQSTQELKQPSVCKDNADLSPLDSISIYAVTHDDKNKIEHIDGNSISSENVDGGKTTSHDTSIIKIIDGNLETTHQQLNSINIKGGTTTEVNKIKNDTHEANIKPIRELNFDNLRGIPEKMKPDDDKVSKIEIDKTIEGDTHKSLNELDGKYASTKDHNNGNLEENLAGMEQDDDMFETVMPEDSIIGNPVPNLEDDNNLEKENDLALAIITKSDKEIQNEIETVNEHDLPFDNGMHKNIRITHSSSDHLQTKMLNNPTECEPVFLKEPESTICGSRVDSIVAKDDAAQ
ncbi:unnamed protein product, partial [Owenia fusiformis]